MFGNLGAKKKPKAKPKAVPMDMGTPTPMIQQDNSGGASYTGLIAGGILIVGIIGVVLYWKK